jgi:phytanoyl-CoA hydroxylase
MTETPTPEQGFQLTHHLTGEHHQFFHANGFIHFKEFIPRDAVRSFLNEIEQIDAYLVKNEIKKINGIPLRYGYDETGERPFIQRIAFASHYSNNLSAFLKDPRFRALTELIAPYEGRVGENEKDGLVINHYLNTAASAFQQLGWHTDSPRDLFLGSRIKPMLNVGLHLDDCPIENGGLRILPGTHRQSTFRLLFRKKYFIDHRPDSREVGFNINAGDLTVHDGRTWHRVQRSPHYGEKSRRRVMYIPIVTGAYQPKNSYSPTPFYHSIGVAISKKYRLTK